MDAVLIRIDAQNASGAALTLRLASHDRPDLCHLGGEAWAPVLASPPDFALDFFGGAFSGQISAPRTSFAAATSGLAAFAASGAARPRFADARVRIWMGDIEASASADLGPLSLRFDGRLTGEPEIDDAARLARFEAAVQDAWADKPLLSLFAGTGGIEGPADLAGQVKPLALGAIRFAGGVLIDQVDNVWLVSDGPIEAVDAVYDRLASLGPSSGNYASLAALLAASVPAGGWATCLAQGLVRLGAPPDGRVSFDLRGSNSGTGGFVRRPGALIRRIAERAGGTVDAASLAALDAARPYDLSLQLRNQVTAREVIAQIADSVGAVAGIALTGELFAQPLTITSGGARLDASGASALAVLSVEELAKAAPAWRLATEAEPTFEVHDPGEVAFAYRWQGEYSAARVYRRDDVVIGPDGAAWAYVNATPAAGHALPIWPATSNAYWKIFQPPSSSATTAELSNPAHVVATAADGTSGDYSAAGGVMRLRRGDAVLSPSFSVVSRSPAGSWISIDPSTGAYTVSDPGADTATATLRATLDGVDYDLVYSLAKSRAGAPGADGSPGTPGLNAAVVLIYKRSATQPATSDRPQTTTYTFATGALTGTLNGWSTSVPATNGNPLWVRQASASSTGATDTIDAAEWSAVQQLVADGAPGAAGGNSAVVYIYQRAASAPAAPSTTATYTFATGALTGLDNGWSQNIPAANGQPLWVRTATAFGTGTTDTIAPSEWSDAQKLAEDGAQGPQGPVGPTITLVADNQAFTFVDGAASPASQTITISALLTNISGTATWSTTPSVTLGGSGNTRTLSLANFGSNRQVTIEATIGGITDRITIVRLDRDVAAPANANLVPFSRMEGDRGWGINFNPSSLAATTTYGTSDGRRFFRATATATASGQDFSIGHSSTSAALFVLPPSTRVSVQARVETTGVAAGPWRLALVGFTAAGAQSEITSVSGSGLRALSAAPLQMFVDVPSNIVGGRLEFYCRTTGAGEFSVAIAEPMVTGAASGQTVHPAFTPGPNANDGADVTGENVAAAITGQSPWATTAIPTSRVNNLDDSGNLSSLANVTTRNLSQLNNRAWTNLFRADGTTPITDADAITSLGTAAAITGQGPGATAPESEVLNVFTQRTQYYRTVNGTATMSVRGTTIWRASGGHGDTTMIQSAEAGPAITVSGTIYTGTAQMYFGIRKLGENTGAALADFFVNGNQGHLQARLRGTAVYQELNTGVVDGRRIGVSYNGSQAIWFIDGVEVARRTVAAADQGATVCMSMNSNYSAGAGPGSNAASVMHDTSYVVGGATNVWSQIDGVGRPADNATSAQPILIFGSAFLEGNNFRMTVHDNGTNHYVYTDTLTGGCKASFIQADGTGNSAMRLVRSSDNAFASAELRSTQLVTQVPGSSAVSYTVTRAAGDRVVVTYDGQNYRFYYNGTLMRTAEATEKNAAHYARWHVSYNALAAPLFSLRALEFLPFTQNSFEGLGNLNLTVNDYRTSLGTAAAITGQGPWATTTIPTSRVSNLDNSGNLSSLANVTTRNLSQLNNRAWTNLFRADGTTAITDADAITSLGTAAAITGQGALATKNAVNFATSEVLNRTADYISETTTRRWAAETGADVTATAQRTIEPQFPVIEIKQGDPGHTGNRDITHHAKRGTAALNGGTWSLPAQNLGAGTATIASGTGVVTLSGIVQSGSYTVRYTHTDGVATDLPVNVTYVPASASGGSSSSGSSSISSFSSSSYKVVTNEIAITLPSGVTSAQLSAANVELDLAIAAPTGSTTVQMIWQRESSPGTWVDVGSAATSSPNPSVSLDAGGYHDALPGAITCNATVTGLTAGSAQKFRLRARVSAGNVRVVIPAGAANVTS